MSITTLFGTKHKMTAVYLGEERVPVTRIKTYPLHIVQIKTTETDGYNALQVVFGKSKKRFSQPLLGHLKKTLKPPFPSYIKEIKVKDLSPFKVGETINIQEILKVGDILKVQGQTKGKGFTGVIKRWGFARQPKTHGQSDRTRAPGSIGQATGVARVFKGKKMAGRHGSLTHTVKNAKIIYIAPDGTEIWLTGHVPGQSGKVIKLEKTGHTEIKKVLGIPGNQQQ